MAGPTGQGEAIFSYEGLDAFKRQASLAALDTIQDFSGMGIAELSASRGESAFVFRFGDIWMAGVLEGLGTKNLIADAYDKSHPEGRSGYYYIAQDNIAMIHNDLAVSGAKPLFFWMHHAVEDDSWFNDARRTRDYIEGTRDALIADSATWAAGETPGLSGIIVPGAAELSGFSLGFIGPEERYVRGDGIEEGDEWGVLASSGIHANGASAARKVGDALPDGYETEVEGTGRTYAEELLAPTILYSDFVQTALDMGVKFKRLENLTGHGWRKAMRGPGDFTYRATRVPERLPIFNFLQKHLGKTTLEMFEYYNMGGGFIYYVDKDNKEGAEEAARITGHAVVGEGVVEKGPKQVIIEPEGIVLPGDSLDIRN